MALEAVVFPQDFFGYSTCKEFYDTSGASSGGLGLQRSRNFHDFNGLGGVDEADKGALPLVCELNSRSPDCVDCGLFNKCNVNSPSLETSEGFTKTMAHEPPSTETTTSTRRKRRRSTKSCKNKEEVESQRMTHIAVERNRRKQMNEYLAILRTLMPASCVQRGDQASIVGGAINFVKELEQLLQSLEAQKHVKGKESLLSSPFASFFSFPQYTSKIYYSSGIAPAIQTNIKEVDADIEVTMIESHANLKVRLPRQPMQLLRMVVGLQSLWLTTLHLNVTAAPNQMVFYSFSLKVESGCQFTSVDEIAAAVYQMVERIQNENVL